MFATAQKAAKGLISISKTSTNDISTLPMQYLPKKYSLSQLYEQLAIKDETKTKEDELADLLILSTCLGEFGKRLVRDSSDEEYITQLSLWISNNILPDGTLVVDDEVPADMSSASRQHALLLAQRKGYLGLQSLNTLLLGLDISIPSPINNQILLSAIAFSSPLDPWTTRTDPSTMQLSFQLLIDYESQTHNPVFIVTYLLQTIIRPLFSKSRPSGITESGRKAIPSSAPPKRVDFVAERGQKPWKYDAPYSVSILGWAVEHADESIIKSSWHLFVPPILTLLDDPSTPIRSRGLKVLSTFLPKLDAKLLTQTGLDSVFEDAITPTLLYLPNLTPIEESLLLLPDAYTSLFTLCDVRFTPPSSSSSLISNSKVTSNSTPIPTSHDKIKDTERERLRFLDRITRQGVLLGYTHASTYPAIVEILVSQLSLLISRMGIHSVKHLKDIIPILTTTLSDPFSSSHPSLLREAVRALQTTVLNAWPRIREDWHRVEVIRALVLCWKTVADDEAEELKEGLEQVKREISIAGRLLVSAVEGEIDMRMELGPLLDVDAVLVEGIFGITAEDRMI